MGRWAMSNANVFIVISPQRRRDTKESDFIDISRILLDGNKRFSRACVPKTCEVTAQLIKASQSVYIMSRIKCVKASPTD